jgi:amino acid transporter
MVAATDIKAVPAAAQLKHGALSLPETIGQSIANIAPTLTPALNISVVAGLAGVGSWLSYLIATVGLVFVGACIATLAKQAPTSSISAATSGR